MKTTVSPESVYKEYSCGVDFNTGIKLYQNVRNNENFFIGNQWGNVESNGLPKPQFNFMKRVVLFSVASISTDNLKLNATPLPSSTQIPKLEMETYTDIVNDQFKQLFEMNKLSSQLREFCRNAAVDGDGVMYTYWDADAETGQPSKGAIRTETLYNTQVMFGNPNSRDLQGQPYIVINRRMMVEQAKDRARAFGASQDDIERITSDSKETDESGDLDSLGADKVTVLVRLWKNKATGTVWGYECTKNAAIRQPWDLGLSLYPVNWMSWDWVQDSYHGQAMLTGLIPNQTFINKLYAMSYISMMTTAYPKIVYDKTRIKKWDNRVGAAIGMQGGDVNNVAKVMDPATISPQVSQFIDSAISYTQKFLGASDVAMGDTRPDNTSAIVALQRAASTPMELTKQNLLQAIEDLGRIYLDYMARYYGKRYVEVKNDRLGVPAQVVLFDFDMLRKIPMSINLDVGASSYWSEIATMQTLDNLLMQNKIDIEDYLERIPSGMIADKEGLLSSIRNQRLMAQQQAPATGGAGAGGQIVENGQAPAVVPGQGNGALQRAINQTGEVPKM